MTTTTILCAVASTRRPCDGCSQYFACAEKAIACADFVRFVRSGSVVNESRNPDKRYFEAACK